MITKKEVIVIGAGAAGLMCAAEAGKRGRSILVLERSGKIGSKILISGGGRCNFTNRYIQPDHFVSRNPHFSKSALAQFTAQDIVALVEKHRIPYHEEKHGQLFCDRGSQDIIRLLEKECRAAEAQTQINCDVSEIKRSDGFSIHTDRGIFQSQSLVIATGGLSFPKIGASPFGHNIAKQFGLNVTPCKPALVPMIWNRKDLESFGDLAGVSLDAIVRCGHYDFHDQILLTHKGLSGPAILQISTYWEKEDPILVDVLPGRDLLADLTEGRNRRIEINRLLERHLPRRFVKKWTRQILPPKPLSQWSDKEIRRISNQLHRWQITPGGSEGYNKAEVTAGGVDTTECSSKTMESKKVPGLYFVGEVLDVTGQLGGYNLQWAWSSGFIAGQFA